MKYFVISDVHSFYEPMIEALNKAGFDPNNENHTLISCGDLFDRGPDSEKVLDYVMSLPRKVLVRGNHDTMLEDLYRNERTVDFYDGRNGTIKTICQLGHSVFYSEAMDYLRNNKVLDKYFDELVNYYQTDKYLFVHCWFPHLNPDNPVCYDYNYYPIASKESWDKFMWDNPFEYWSRMHKLHNDLGIETVNKTVVFGHWHTSYAHAKYDMPPTKEFPDEGENWEEVCDFSPFIREDIIGLDACTVFTGKCNCVVLED